MIVDMSRDGGLDSRWGMVDHVSLAGTLTYDVRSSRGAKI